MSRPKGYKHSSETRAKQSAAAKGRVVSEETKKKIRKTVSAQMTPERREVQRQSATGRKHTEAARAKISAASKNRIVSEEIRAKMRGHEVTPETRAKIRARLAGHIVAEETRRKIAEKIRPIAPFSFRGGETAEAFAQILYPAGFIREHHVLWGKGNERFVLDFAHLDGKVNIELDGSSHDGTQERDALRDYVLMTLGWRVIRIKI